MQEQAFEIEGELPGMNEYVNACKASIVTSSRMKTETDNIVVLYAKAAHLKPVDGPYEIAFCWIEGRKKDGNPKWRDIDNIAAGAKFVLDGLQKAGVLPQDNPKWFRGLYHSFKFNERHPRVQVAILPWNPNGRTIHYLPITGIEGEN